ncbi:uncharacterized protein LOC127812336 isoform X2 [Diospyros lotus]|uniref:uncharacterized protein LOC127812336 isoform X2 n=1 Tax=Diospyros lotus TaxID=55363 RepID=UPI00224F8351|nr:uncharacterized protein LOC127812336 isoform X2 [Diospyros lotus]
MEESQEILLKSLAKSGVQIPPEVSSIGDLTPATLVAVCAQSLRFIDETKTASFSVSLPDSMADRFKICTDLANAFTDLGFIGDISFHKFLYPSEEDLYTLMRFLVKKLSELPEEVEVVDKRKDNVFKDTLDLSEQSDIHRVDQNSNGVTTRLKDLRLNTEMPETSNFRSTVKGSSKEDLGSVEDDRESMEQLGGSIIEECADPMDEKDASEIEQKLNSIRYKIGKLRSLEKVLVEEASAKTLEVQHLEEEHELLKSAAEMAFNDQDTADFYILQLNDQIDERRRHLTELEKQSHALRKPLEEKRKSLEEALYASQPESLEKLKKMEKVELETEAVLFETKKRVEERSKLSADLENQPKLASRKSYIERVTEITKNSGKQDSDIERILRETRELQLESNYIQERLNRTFAVVDETVFREAKKNPVARQAYRLLTSIHESFEQISDNILTTDRIRREVTEYEAKLSALARRSFKVDKLKADLDAIRRENELIEKRLNNSQNAADC